MKDLKMFINGQFCESSNGKWIEVLNPSTEEVISRQPEGTIEDVNRALDAARAAQKAWGKTPAIERAGYLLKMAEGIKKREKEFTEIIMREQGKTRTWASIEVGATIAYFEYMATFARHIEGEIIPSDRPNETILLTKKPIGVVAGILPWNFPFFLIARKAGAALIAGCTIVIKPSQLTPENCTEFPQASSTSSLVRVPSSATRWQALPKSILSASQVPSEPARASWPQRRRTSPRYRSSWAARLPLSS